MKKKMLNRGIITLLLFTGFTVSSCVSVRPYQKAYLNDSEMELSLAKTEKYEQNFLLYREGSSGANGGKSGGGCGCN